MPKILKSTKLFPGPVGRSRSAGPIRPAPAGDLKEAQDLSAEPRSVSEQDLRIGPDGRVLIPQEMRQAMRLGATGKVTAWVDKGELHIRAPLVGVWQAQQIARKYFEPGTTAIVDEFLAERRASWGDE